MHAALFGTAGFAGHLSVGTGCGTNRRALSHADISYVWAGDRCHYLAVVVDLCTRCVVGPSISDKPNAQLVVDALEVALDARGVPKDLMVHLDQGSQGRFNRSSQHF